MSFFQKWIVEPLNDYLYGLRKIGETMGIQPVIDKTVYSFEEKLFYQLFKSRFNFEIINGDVLPKNREEPVIIASNHTSLIDPIVIGDAICHSSDRQPYQLAKVELATDPLLNNFTRMNHAIYIRRGDSDETALEKCKQALNEGNILIIFPEGTIGPGNGKFLDFKAGALRLSYECQIPIIPAAIYGTDRVFGKNAKMPQTTGKLMVKFGKVLTVESLFKTPKKDNQMDGLDFTKATSKVQRECEKLWMDLWMIEQEAKKKAEHKANPEPKQPKKADNSEKKKVNEVTADKSE